MAVLDVNTATEQDFANLDICIIGAGPAGLTIAKELMDTGLKVALLECGSLVEDMAVKGLAAGAGESIGDSYPDARYTSVRRFGGMAHKWKINMTGSQPTGESLLISHLESPQEDADALAASGCNGVRYIALEEIDFEQRDWLPHSGWPISLRDLTDYYQRAHVLCKTGPYDYNTESWIDGESRPLEVDAGIAMSKIFMFGPRTVFTKEIYDALARSTNVHVFLNATVTEVDTNDQGDSVVSARIKNLQGLERWITAKQFVLAAGAIEITRLLFNSNRVHPNGLGNHSDKLGRFLMDHPAIRSGIIRLKKPGLLKKLALYDTHWVRGHMVSAKLVLTEAFRRSEKLLGMSVAIFPRAGQYKKNWLSRLFPKGMRFRSPAVRSSIVLKNALRRKRLPEEFLSHVWNVLTGLDDLLIYRWRKSHPPRHAYGFDTGGWSRLESHGQFGYLELTHITEQSPDPDNRLVITEQRDALGVRKLQQYWEWKDRDVDSVLRSLKVLAQEIEKAGVGKLEYQFDKGVPRMILPSIHHFMGTTRMSKDPEDGVVDPQCRVHGVKNLFVAGSSVFPTGGYANPTITIVALAIRIADELKGLICMV